ncbi:hypothetical protein PMI14_03349, partial [Acidovorax sp. CF316]
RGLRLAAAGRRACAQRRAAHAGAIAGHCQRTRHAGRGASPRGPRARGRHGADQAVPGHRRADAAGAHGGYRRAGRAPGARHALPAGRRAGRHARDGRGVGARFAVDALPRLPQRGQCPGVPAGAGRKHPGHREPGCDRPHAGGGWCLLRPGRPVGQHGPCGQPGPSGGAGRHRGRHPQRAGGRQGARHPDGRRKARAPLSRAGRRVRGRGVDTSVLVAATRDLAARYGRALHPAQPQLPVAGASVYG